VVRQTHRDDRRIKVLVVTAEGRRVRDQLIARLFDPPEALRRLDDVDTARFRDAMLDVVASTIAK
jgi:DNA-binding MarR family transcriptional regulator